MWILLSGEVTTGRVCEYIVISVEFAQTCSLNLMLRWDGIYLIGFGSDVRPYVLQINGLNMSD